MTIIAIVGSGAMGAGIGGLLTGNGCTVLSPLEERSPESRKRAARARMTNATYEELGSASLIISIVPPAQAAFVASRLEPLLARRGAPPFIEANALSPVSKRSIAQRITTNGGAMIDGVIIGSPPREGEAGPRFYVSGERAVKALPLRQYGLDVRLLPGLVGAAAALKMSYGSLNKGITALTTASLLAAERAGALEALLAELAISQQHLLSRSQRSVPDMYPKAYRWVAEFEEVVTFMRDDPSSAAIFEAIARFYSDRAVAHDHGEEPSRIGRLLTERS